MDFAAQRAGMVAGQLAARGLHDHRVLRAMGEVPREQFVPPGLAGRAYEDAPLGISAGQTISQPYIVALMCEALALVGSEKVLEVGTGSGYGAAVLGLLAREVHTIERHAMLAASAGGRLAALGLLNVHVHQGDGTLGLPDQAPFDGIVVTASGPHVPPALLDQLAIGARLVIPVGGHPERQRLLRIERQSERVYNEKDLGGVAFVPLLGEEGWEPS